MDTCFWIVYEGLLGYSRINVLFEISALVINLLIFKKPYKVILILSLSIYLSVIYLFAGAKALDHRHRTTVMFLCQSVKILFIFWLRLIKSKFFIQEWRQLAVDDFGFNLNVFLNLERPFMDTARPIADHCRNSGYYNCIFNCLLLSPFKIIMSITPNHSKNELLWLLIGNCLPLHCSRMRYHVYEDKLEGSDFSSCFC